MLGKKKDINEINRKLKKIRYPSEFSRTQRTLDQFKLFKASEFRNFLFYSGVFALHGVLDAECYKHFIAYVLFMRILTCENQDENVFNSLFILINYFISKFQKIYGENNMNYKLHAHIHFIYQFYRFGSINKISSFPFEGFFKRCREYIHGTTGYLSQIHANINLNRIVDYELPKILPSIGCFRMRSFVESQIKANGLFSGEKLLKSIMKKNLNSEEQEFFKDFNFENIDLLKKVVINNIGNYYIFLIIKIKF